MNRLFLLRHAKARRADPGERDFDRALKKSGLRDASAMAEEMARLGFVPGLVLCSPARRTRETWEQASEHLPTAEVVYLEALYAAGAAGYLDIVRKHARGEAVMIVGHNPMTEDLAAALAGPAADELSGGFPTCGLAVIDCEVAFSEIEPLTGRLVAFLTPGGLGQD